MKNSSHSGLSHLFAVIGFVLLALLCYGHAMWPLPVHFTDMIPLSDQAGSGRALPEGTHPADSIQLLYHFWLGYDSLAGHSPAFSNVYEFNLGDDSARTQADFHYFPFSLVFAALHPLLGAAVAWNVTGVVSYLFGLFFLYLWARRFAPGPSRLPAALAALLGGTLPYRLITLVCGSPTGFAIALPPLLAYGMDRAIRDRSPLGWGLVFVELFCAYASDLHVFYFSALATPGLALLSLTLAAPSWRDWLATVWRSARVLLPMLPLALLLLGAIAYVTFLAHQNLAQSSLQGGRTIFEMAAYSPMCNGLFEANATGMARHIYFGWPLLVLLVVGLLLAGWTAARQEGRARLPRVAVVLLVLGILTTILLGLGIHAPPAGLWIRLARKLVPKYSMIRQTAKIYCLLPTFVVPLLALIYRAVLVRGSKTELDESAHASGDSRGAERGRGRLVNGMAIAFVWIFSALVILGNLDHVRPVLTQLPERAPALDAVLSDAAGVQDEKPLALAIPIWPGDSHWSSLYEYDAVLSRIRFINGYSPAAPADYRQNVFQRFESINQGVADDAQLDALLAMGCHYILYYPHAFPETVSPWPPVYTLQGLRANPRLQLLESPFGPPASDWALPPQTVAFRILRQDEKQQTDTMTSSNALDVAWFDALPPPTRLHFFCRKPVGLRRPERLKLRAPIFAQPNLRMELLLAAVSPRSVALRPLPSPEGPPVAVESLPAVMPTNSATSGWFSTPLASPYGLSLSTTKKASAGPLPTLVQAYLAAGPVWKPRSTDGAYAFPASRLWFSGRMLVDEQTGLCQLDSPAIEYPPAATTPGLALYGPNLPVPPGVYLPVLRHNRVSDNGIGSFQVTYFNSPDILASTALQADTEETRLPLILISDPPMPFRFELILNKSYAKASSPLVVTEALLLPVSGTMGAE
ncbi:MAG: hypothetical protein IJT88_04020 [Kiritimatiellae bacterium]|nr:hypothetical protein [Kiritimatiellia bacterium]